MAVIVQTLTGFPADDPAGVPLIGWHNLVTTGNVTSTTADADFPITNVANPATHLKWVGGVNTGDEVITIAVNAEIDYVAVVKHNWGTLAVPVTINTGSDQVCLLHFDGTDGATTFTDSSPSSHTFTPVGNAQIDTAQSKFGGASGLFDGTGDYLTGDGSSSFAFGDSDFTIDFWIRFASVTGDQFLYDSRPAANGSYAVIYMASGATLRYHADGTERITGTTALIIDTWYHIAVTRSGTSTRLFLNGVQEGSTYTDSLVYVVGASRPVIATDGFISGSSLNGWIDELRVLKGTAAWTTTFTPPTSAYDAASAAVISGQTLTDDDPVIFRFTPQLVVSLTISLAVGDSGIPPEAAVIYVGELLVLERSIKIGANHVPVTYGRRTKLINGMSESGNFLGRIATGEYRQSKAEFEWFTSAFYRSDIDAFLEAAQERPFFWAWSPEEYPAETGYVWLMNDAEPEVDPTTRRIALTLEMRGVA